jgi:hypothetical protein
MIHYRFQRLVQSPPSSASIHPQRKISQSPGAPEKSTIKKSRGDHVPKDEQPRSRVSTRRSIPPPPPAVTQKDPVVEYSQKSYATQDAKATVELREQISSTAKLLKSLSTQLDVTKSIAEQAMTQFNELEQRVEKLESYYTSLVVPYQSETDPQRRSWSTQF